MPLFAGFLGEKIPILTWVAATAALVGVGLLESSGTPPSVCSLPFALKVPPNRQIEGLFYCETESTKGETEETSQNPMEDEKTYGICVLCPSAIYQRRWSIILLQPLEP